MAGQEADIVLHGGPVFTVDYADSVVDGLAVKDGLVLRSGSSASVLELVGEGTTVVDLAGRAVVPGFIDAHTHWELTAHVTQLWVNATTEDRDGVLRRVAEEAQRRKPDEWIVMAGSVFEPLPLRQDLDVVAPDHPVVVRSSMHALGANTLALERAGLLSAGSVPKKGARVQVGPDGLATGFVEEGFDLFPVPAPAKEDLARALTTVGREVFARHGVTTIHDMPASRLGVQCYQQLANQGKLSTRVRLHYILPPVHQSVASLDELVPTGLQSGFGNDWFDFGGVKLFVDGFDKAAAYGDKMVGNTARDALIPRTFEELVMELERAFQARIQVLMHAWGDYAQQMALDAVEAALIAAPSGYEHRTRIEHMTNYGYDPTALDRARALGVIPVGQASFMLGEDPAVNDHPKYVFASAYARGIDVPGSSDCSGLRTWLASPWVGISAMVARRHATGTLVSPEEAVSFEQALRSWTINSARAGREEDVKGSLELGKFADLSIVDQDPRTVSPEELAEVNTVVTMVGGQVTWSTWTALPDDLRSASGRP